MNAIAAAIRAKNKPATEHGEECECNDCLTKLALSDSHDQLDASDELNEIEPTPKSRIAQAIEMAKAKK